MSDDESPYCEVCGTCGYLGCCGIRNFIEEHIKGKTNCKNEDIVINELIDLCDYRDEVFKENDRLKKERKEILELIKNRNTTKSKKERFMSGKSTLDRILEILEEEENENIN